MATGPHNSGYQIPDLVVSDTFHDWFQVTNQEIINKLNRMELYTLGASMDGILGITNSAGEVRFEISDHITKGITFEGDLVFNGTVTRMNSTDFSVDDYNIVLGDTGPQGGTLAGTGASDTQIGNSGGGGLILRRGSSGPDASWLWQPSGSTGSSGAWESNSHIQLNEAARFLSGENIFRFESGGSGEHFDIRHDKVTPAGLTAYGLSGGAYGSHNTSNVWGAENDLVLSYGGSLGATTEFMRVHDDGYVEIPYGVNKKRIYHENHGFKFGEAVRLDATTNGYTWGIADDKGRAEVIGLISYVNGNTFDITYSGEIRGSFGDCLGEADGDNLLQGNAYFLSPTEHGKLTLSVTDTVNYVQKPLLLATGTGEGLVVNYLGGVVAEAAVAGAAASQRLLISATGGHFLVGDVVRMDRPSGNYVRAQCNTDDEAEALGVITQVNIAGETQDSYLTTSGIVSFGTDDIEDGGLDIGSVYFLNSNCEGVAVQGNCLTKDDPDTVGFVRKPIMTAISTTQASLLNFIGVRISDDSVTGNDTASGSAVNTIIVGERVYFSTQKYLHNGQEGEHPDHGVLQHAYGAPAGTTSKLPHNTTSGPAELGSWRNSGTTETFGSGYTWNKAWGIFDLSEEVMDIPDTATHAILSVFFENSADVGAGQLLWNAGGEESANKISLCSSGHEGDLSTVEVPIGADRKGFLTGYNIGMNSPYCTVVGYITTTTMEGNYNGESVDIESSKTIIFGKGHDLSPETWLDFSKTDGSHMQNWPQGTHADGNYGTGTVRETTTDWKTLEDLGQLQNRSVYYGDHTNGHHDTEFGGIDQVYTYDVVNDYGVPSTATHAIINLHTYAAFTTGDSWEVYAIPGEIAHDPGQHDEAGGNPVLAVEADKLFVISMRGERSTTRSQSTDSNQVSVPLIDGKFSLYIDINYDHDSDNAFGGVYTQSTSNSSTGWNPVDALYHDSIQGILVGYIDKQTQTIISGAISNVDGDNNRRKNINGNFDIWQRTTDGDPYTWQFNSPEKDKYMADTWHSKGVVNNKVDARRKEFDLSGTEGVDYLPLDNSYPAQYYLRFGSSGPDSANAGSPSLQTVIEDATTFHGKNCAFSFWCKGDTTSRGTGKDSHIKLKVYQYAGIVDGEAYGVSVLDAGTGGGDYAISSVGATPVETSYIAFDDEWRKYSGSLTLPTLGGASTPLGEGATANVGCIGINFIVSEDDEGWTGDFDIAQFQFEQGGAVTKFEDRTYGRELADCSRYYQIACGGFDTANGAGAGTWGAGTSFLVEMRKIKNDGGRPRCVDSNIGGTDNNSGHLGTYVNGYSATTISDVLVRNHRGFILSKTKPTSDGAYFSTYAFTADF